jgi:hypothetical protein
MNGEERHQGIAFGLVRVDHAGHELVLARNQEYTQMRELHKAKSKDHHKEEVDCGRMVRPQGRRSDGEPRQRQRQVGRLGLVGKPP